MKENRTIDITKFICSILVIGIHAGLASKFINPLLRIAVPIFFVYTSYFFFCGVSSENCIYGRYKTFIKRNMRLYGFWFVVLFLPTIMLKKYYLNPLQMVFDFFLSSTFPVSWYIVASILAVSILIIVRNRWILACITITSYGVCLLSTNYAFIDIFAGGGYSTILSTE